ncbi:MAG: alkaline phosphatase D family protein [Betaproteobacteria bacterium]|nr:alkaline phosphatase D family protein [Betaproteobacteria bacterium]
MPAPTDRRSRRASRRLASLVRGVEDELLFDVVIVGSGYGGSMAAAELANAVVDGEKPGGSRRLSVCLLERGEEYLPGEFPADVGELPRHVRVSDQASGAVRGFHQGLFDLRLGPDVAALVANGLGGGSLINAGVMLEPRAEDFEPGSVMGALLESLHASSDTGRSFFAEAGLRLGSRENHAEGNTIRRHKRFRSGDHPQGPLPAKTAALQTLAGSRTPELAPITVSMTGGGNHAGVALDACTLCGDCLTGCNVGAKDSLDANLLEIASRGGVEIVTGATVLSIRRARPSEIRQDRPPRWVLRVAHTDPRLQDREATHFRIGARRLILSAGTLGTTEILLRSRDERLVFSPRLGERFSCNGDNIAAVHRMPQTVNARAMPDTRVTEGSRAVGPTITASIPVRRGDPALETGCHAPGARGFLIQEFAVPAALRQFFDELVTTRHVLEQLPNKDDEFHGTRRAEASDPMAVDASAMERTLLVGVIGHDDAAGSLHLSNPSRPRDRVPQQGGLLIRWPNARHGADLNNSHAVLHDLVGHLPTGDPTQPPSLVANPMWRLIPDKLAELVAQPRGPVLTVHPLGGCAIGRSIEDGVVDEYGCVFNGLRTSPDAAPDDDWQGSLVILDGSIIPGSLGVNPSLTIAATALRAMAHHRRAWGVRTGDAVGTRWAAAGQAGSPETTLPRRRVPLPPTPPAAPTEIEITERLRGTVLLHAGVSCPSPFMVDLTLRYRRADLTALSTRAVRELELDPERSRLRLFRQADWDRLALRFQPEWMQQRHAVLEASLRGSLRFLHREPSSAWRRQWRGLCAWGVNRGARDSLQYLLKRLGGRQPATGNFLRDLLRTASRAGEVRRFDYALQVEAVLTPADRITLPCPAFMPGDAIQGHKRLTYGKRANPWRQLGELTLTAMPHMQAGQRPVLGLDLRFMAAQGIPLVQIVSQQDQVRALGDLASFGLYMARVIVNNHLWTFRKPDEPDAQSRVEPQRLPGPIAGLANPEITELKVGLIPGTTDPVIVRLTHYRAVRSADSRPGALPPLVMLHGYSASGTTFTHDTLAPSAAAHFCRAGRDVWVVDLRTSTGMRTATLPWALEEPALVDIPAALLHIRTVTGQRVDVLAHCVGAAMLSMALLTDARDIRSSEVQLGIDTWITDEQLGTLTAFNGPRPSGDSHPCIRRIVLSQKGPVLRYPDDNVFRTFLLRRIRRLVLPADYRFRSDANPGVAAQLLDRLLSSLPYPDREYDAENPFPRFWKTTPWTAVRHRMDLLYGRTFSAANLSDATLNRLDDLFGPMNIDTLAQIIHFARFDAITNQRGRGEFVTRRKLRDRWGGIPTLAIHGQENGLVDVATQDLLSKAMGFAGVPFRTSPSDQPPYQALGHQDVLIGRQSVAVFEDIEAFLGEASADAPARRVSATPSEKPARPAQYRFMPPWIGPRIDLPDDPRAGRLTIAALSNPDQGHARLALIPVHRRVEQGVSRFLPASDRIALSAAQSSSRWLRAEPLEFPPAEAPASDAIAGHLALIVHEVDTLSEPDGDAAAGEPKVGMVAGPTRVNPGTPEATALAKALAEWLRTADPGRLAEAFLRQDELDRAWRLHTGNEPGALRVAFGSCQYPPGLFDRPVAEGSLRRLAESLGPADSPDPVRSPGPDLVLLLGDQIYADATGGFADATRIDERVEQPHDDALRVSPLRELMRRRPVRTLIDDHELIDNWEPMPEAVALRRPDEARRRQQTQEAGREAFLRYQRMRPAVDDPASGRRRRDILARPVDQHFAFAGHAFYLLDTRTGRSARGSSTAPQERLIIDERQWYGLRDWLLARPRALKFVATASALLARRRHIADHPEDTGSSDAWDGFPESLRWLIEFLYFNRISNTVFLSGDEHHSFHAEARVTSPDDDHILKIVSIHSSALYAPFPFANGRPLDFLPSDAGPGGGVECYRVGNLHLEVTMRFAPPGDGYAVLEVPSAAQRTNDITLHYLKRNPPDARPIVLSLD